MDRLPFFLRQRHKVPALLLVLLVALSTSLSAAHVHDIEKYGALNQLEQMDDCALCHAGVAFTFETGGWSQAEAFLQSSPNAQRVSARQLGYIYRPESRPPPYIS